jgi:hypothetical protein
MKQKLFLTIFLLITGAGLSFVQAQSLAIHMQDGTEQTFSLSSLGNITFSTSNLVVNQNTGTTESYSLSNISKIYFMSVPTGTDDEILTANTKALSFYPNPVRNSICFRNVPGNGSTVKIYRMDGRMMLQSLVSSDNNSLDASDLPAGFYFISVNNQTLKFIKL